ncbi:hypothetical protein BaRGS_00011574 [Batillaria attramentaria]|uniref:Uncharacterized protein n=1 Tax=Batillaria attramentaria TaxID=370345 RepID=A0ABD0LD23_9CAEN
MSRRTSADRGSVFVRHVCCPFARLMFSFDTAPSKWQCIRGRQRDLTCHPAPVSHGVVAGRGKEGFVFLTPDTTKEVLLHQTEDFPPLPGILSHVCRKTELTHVKTMACGCQLHHVQCL